MIATVVRARDLSLLVVIVVIIIIIIIITIIIIEAFLLRRLADLSSRSRLWSSSSSQLAVRPSRTPRHCWRSIVLSAAPRICNSLPGGITSAASLAIRRKLKTYLFQLCYPDVIIL